MNILNATHDDIEVLIWVIIIYGSYKIVELILGVIAECFTDWLNRRYPQKEEEPFD